MRLRFTIRDLLWLTAVVGLGIALIFTTIENQRLLGRIQVLEDQTP